MITSNGYTVQKIKNPYPKKWPGPWFSFVRFDGFHKERGEASSRTLASYIGNKAFKEVVNHFPCLQTKQKYEAVREENPNHYQSGWTVKTKHGSVWWTICDVFAGPTGLDAKENAEMIARLLNEGERNSA